MQPSEILQHLEKLRGFALVARLGGFHKASRELGLSQPALSRSIDNLESIVGKKLLIRSTKGTRPTPEGELILSFFEKIESAAGDLAQKIRTGHAAATAGEIRVASYETLCTYFWPSFLKSFGKKYPDLRIILLTENEREHWSKLASGAIDVVVDAEPRNGNEWDSFVLYTDKFGLYAAKGYESSAEETIDLISVEKAYDENGLTIRDHFIKNGVKFREAYKLDTFISSRSFVLAGLGVGALPQRLVEDDVASGRLKKVVVKGMPAAGFGKHRICFSTLRQNSRDSRLELLKRELKTIFA